MSSNAPARMAANTTLTNSAWTARRIADWYGAMAAVIHPPVPVDREGLAWEQRSDSFATIGRIAPVKQVIETIGLIERVREHGHPVSLLICGQRDDARYEAKLRRIAASRPWVELLLDAPRDAMLDRVGACRSVGLSARDRLIEALADPESISAANNDHLGTRLGSGFDALDHFLC